MSKISVEASTLNSIVLRAHYIANRMVFEANQDKGDKGDPKVGGHNSANCSSIHILGALHLKLRSGYDFICNKPHASPADHSYNYLLDLLFQESSNLSQKLTEKEAHTALSSLRKFKSAQRPYTFQSYHSIHDPDHFNFLPSGSVGIPPVNIGYLALSYKMLQSLKGVVLPPTPAHFWALIGDAEFREGSLLEAMPDFAERGLDNLTWIIDYNRQGLDGHRITSNSKAWKTDAHRIAKTAEANGWEVINVQHGILRQSAFTQKGGETFQAFLESELTDYELQTLLLTKSEKELYSFCQKNYKQLKVFLENSSPKDFQDLLHNMGGHDLEVLINALQKSKSSKSKPTLIIAHTIKGWGLDMKAQSSNHSSLITKTEVESLQKSLKLTKIFEKFSEKSNEGKFLKARGDELLKDMKNQLKLKASNESVFFSKTQTLPDSLNVNFKMASYPHTQWMLGQLTAKLTRVATTNDVNLTKDELAFKPVSHLFVTMAPDVGTSTNLNSSMDGHVYGFTIKDHEKALSVKENKSPNLVPNSTWNHRFLRFDITEANTTSCLGSLGKIKDILGIPLMPLMTVYDFFVKRALDQHFYNLYWKSSFLLAGTPSGVTLSYEGAQHGWKSDIQIPGQITWEPFFCWELDWIFCDSLKRYFQGRDEKRKGVHIRCVTKGVEQKKFLICLKKQNRFKNFSDAEILEATRQDVLQGGYWLIHYIDYEDYRPGDNVVNIYAMGALVDEALKASEALLKQGVYGNVIVVTSSDLLLTEMIENHNYTHLNKLHAHSNLYFYKLTTSQKNLLAGRKVPVVSVHDGELGLLDNIGSLVGVKQKALAVTKHSLCGKPQDVYAHHKIDAHSIELAAFEVLESVANEQTLWPE